MKRLPKLGAAAWLVVVAAVLIGCSSELLETVEEDVERALEPDLPVIEITQGATPVSDGSVVAYGSQPQDSSTDFTLSIKNAGSGTLLLETPQVTPSSALDGFSVQSLSGTSVAAGASVNLVLRFHPGSGSAYAAAATIASNATNDSSVAFDLTGTGVAPDLQPPTGSVSISAGATYATGTSVTLTIAAADTGGGSVAQMLLSNSDTFAGAIWEPYDTSRSWTLDGPDGTDTVYIRFKDGSDNISGTYSDTITLDRVNPTISSRTPASGATWVSRSTNITVNFSESMNQATLTEASVYARIKGTTAALPLDDLQSTATSITIYPEAPLLYGYDYQIVVTSAVKDLAGRAVTTTTVTSDFTVERDYWEGTDGNDTVPKDLTFMNPRKTEDVWFDFVDDIQDEEWSFPKGVHSKLAVLEGVDRYKVTVPPDVYYLEVRVLFTTNEATGTEVDSSGTDSLNLYLHDGVAGMGGAIQQPPESDEPYDRWYIFDIDGADTHDYSIMVTETSSNYANRRKYNLRWRYGTGM